MQVLTFKEMELLSGPSIGRVLGALATRRDQKFYSSTAFTSCTARIKENLPMTVVDGARRQTFACTKCKTAFCIFMG